MGAFANNQPRYCIFFFYDRDGIVDRYVTYLLEDLCKNMTETVIVCNGKLNEDGRRRLSQYSDRVIVRENKGLDVYAYREGIQAYSWEKLAKAGELVLCNATIMGPVYPFAETFEKMASRELDFWGITPFFKSQDNPYNNPYGYIPTHIQSNFMVYRNSLLNSKELREFWDNPPEINSYEDSVGLYESWFTKHFADLGYRWDVSVDVADLQAETEYPLIFSARELLQNRRCPIFKRRSFFRPGLEMCGAELMDYLKTSTDYDTGMIWENILRTSDQYEVCRNMNLNYALRDTDERRTLSQVCAARHDLCVIAWVGSSERILELKKYLTALPGGTDICVFTDSDDRIALINELLGGLPWGHFEVRVSRSAGGNSIALLLEARDVIERHDICCLEFGSRVKEMDARRQGSVSAEYYKNAFGTESNGVIGNVLELFTQNVHLGLLLPQSIAGEMDFITIENGSAWQEDYPQVKQMMDCLGIQVPISPVHPPIVSMSEVFWFRSDALKLLLNPKCALQSAAMIGNGDLQKQERILKYIYALVAQQYGYYSAYCWSEELSREMVQSLIVHCSRFVQSWHSCESGWKDAITYNEQLESFLDYRSAQLMAKEKEVSEYGEVIAQKDAAIAEKDKWIASQAELLDYRSAQLTAKEKEISEYGEVVAQRDTAIAEKDKWIASQMELLDYRSAQLTAKEKEISEYGEVVAQRDMAIAEKDKWIATVEKMLRDKQEDYSVLEAKLEKCETDLTAERQRLFAIENSWIWQHTKKLHKGL